MLVIERKSSEKCTICQRRNDLSEDHEQSLYKYEIICDRAHILFGLILRLLCQRANVTQDELEERSRAYRDYLFAKGYLKPGHVLSSLDQAAISRVISGDRWPSYDQVTIWIRVLEDTFKSDAYKNERKGRGLTIYDLPYDLKVDLFHLAGFGAPGEIVASYERRLHMATEPTPRVSRESFPRRPSRYSKRTNGSHLEEPMH